MTPYVPARSTAPPAHADDLGLAARVISQAEYELLNDARDARDE